MNLVYFTDRDLGLKFPDILRNAGLIVERHADHFRPQCPDEEWLSAVAKHSWVALTHDARIRYKPNELAAVIAHNARLLVIVGKAPFPDLATSFVQTHTAIVRFVERHQPPFIGSVLRGSGRTREKPGRTGPDRALVSRESLEHDTTLNTPRSRRDLP